MHKAIARSLLIRPYSLHPGTGTDRQGFPAKLGASYPENWSLSAVFWRKEDPLVCPKCNGQMAVIAFIEDSDVIKKILKHLGLQPGPSADDYIADPFYPAVPRLAGLGKIISLSQETQEMIISFDGRNVVYDFADLDEIVLAYAVSVHKSQGSEYPAVVIPLLTQHYILLQRNLIYTAVTRGKNLVVIVGSKKSSGNRGKK